MGRPKSYTFTMSEKHKRRISESLKGCDVQRKKDIQDLFSYFEFLRIRESEVV